MIEMNHFHTEKALVRNSNFLNVITKYSFGNVEAIFGPQTKQI